MSFKGRLVVIDGYKVLLFFLGGGREVFSFPKSCLCIKLMVRNGSGNG